MSPALRAILAIGPLAAYLAAVGGLLAGRRPVVVSGRLDHALLAAGLGGPIVFGPIGGLVADRLFPEPSGWAWAALASIYLWISLLWSRRCRCRLIVYGVDPTALDRAVGEALIPGFSPTTRGFENRASAQRLIVEAGWFGAGTIEAIGNDPSTTIAELRPRLRERLDRVRTARTGRRPTWAFWIVLAALSCIIPLGIGLLMRAWIVD